MREKILKGDIKNMKLRNIFISSILVLLIAIAPVLVRDAGAEGEEDKTFSMTLFPVGLAFSYYSFELEYKLSQNTSIPLEIKIFSPDVTGWDLSFLSIGPGFRYYPAGEGMQGVFVGPYVSFLSYSMNYEYRYAIGDIREVSASAAGVSIAAWFGYRVLAGPVVIEFSTGFGFYAISGLEVEYKDSLGVTHKQEFTGTGGSGFGWSGIGLGVGFAF